MRIRFEDCVFDSDTHEVLRRGRALSVGPKAFQMLEILIRERPNAVSKRQFHTELWPGIFVSEANLPNLVGELRSALGDRARHSHIIRTVRGFGYAFSATAQAVASIGRDADEAPLCRLIWGNREIALASGENLIGRATDSVLFIDHSSVSRRHARIMVNPPGATLEDLGSKNGTLLRGKRIARAERLSDKDSIEIGPASMVFRIFKHMASTTAIKR